jgi:hypothetical protein
MHIVYIDKGVNKYIVYGSMDFSYNHKGKWANYWCSTSIWFVPEMYGED